MLRHPLPCRSHARSPSPLTPLAHPCYAHYQAQKANILAARAVSNLLRTSLGPKGMDKVSLLDPCLTHA